jgi:hypothetical protein
VVDWVKAFAGFSDAYNYLSSSGFLLKIIINSYIKPAGPINPKKDLLLTPQE